MKTKIELEAIAKTHDVHIQEDGATSSDDMFMCPHCGHITECLEDVLRYNTCSLKTTCDSCFQPIEINWDFTVSFVVSSRSAKTE
jgi:transcription elongation factor Elf1